MTLSVDLGKIKFQWKGDWSAATTYKRDDVVYRSGSAFVCVPVTSVNQDPLTNTTQWNKMAQGSDLGSIANLAAGDLVYFDGTDFTRIPTGSAGQVLRIGSSGPEFAYQGILQIESQWSVPSGGPSYSANTIYTVPNTAVTLTTIADNSSFEVYGTCRINDVTSTSSGGDVGFRYTTDGGSSWTYLHEPDMHSTYVSGANDKYFMLQRTHFTQNNIQVPAGTTITFELLVQMYNSAFYFFEGNGTIAYKKAAEQIVKEIKF
jgi:hypothetical protein